MDDRSQALRDKPAPKEPTDAQKIAAVGRRELRRRKRGQTRKERLRKARAERDTQARIKAAEQVARVDAILASKDEFIQETEYKTVMQQHDEVTNKFEAEYKYNDLGGLTRKDGRRMNSAFGGGKWVDRKK